MSRSGDKFYLWKAVTIAKLVEIAKKYGDNKKVSDDINVIITKLHHAKSRDLPSILYYMYVVARDDGVKEVLELIPSHEEIESLMGVD